MYGFLIVFSVAQVVNRQYFNLEARFQSQGKSIWDVWCINRYENNFWRGFQLSPVGVITAVPHILYSSATDAV
jgi:hypothetical protein